jgi:hypothetical protein
MAYPVVSAPYGLLPQNLIGGQVFAGSTRMYPIIYGYSTDIFYGDFVVLSRGRLQRVSVSTGTSEAQAIGIFLGCTYTNPLTKQKQFSQYWPSGTIAGDAQAYVTDDPDTVFKAVVCSSGTTVASGAVAMIGTNVSAVNNTGSTNTGNSANAVLAPTSTTTTILPLRVVGLVQETAVALGTGTYSSISTATVTLASALGFTPPVGTDVGSIAANGQFISSGSYVASVTNSTTIVLNAAPATAFVASSTLVFTQYPEVLVKFNQTVHGYYSATGGA